MRLTKRSTVVVLVFLVLLARASLPLAKAGPLEPALPNVRKTTENTQGKSFGELGASSVASSPILTDMPRVQADSDNVEVVGWDLEASLAVDVQGHYAYLGVGPRLAVLDISDPANPTMAGQTDLLPGVVLDVALASGCAYVAASSAGLRVVDVSDPAHPQEVGYYDTPGGAWDVAVADGYAYVADREGGLRVVDVSDPAHPHEVGHYDTPGDAWDVAVAANYGYVAAAEGGVRVVDISDPAHPHEVGYYDTEHRARGVAVVGDYAYMGDDGGLWMVDVSDPTYPHEVGYYDSPGGAWGVAVVGQYAYVATLEPGLRVVDVSDPTHPHEVGYYDTPGEDSWGVAVVGHYAYVPAEAAGLRVVDVSNPTHPQEVGYYDTPWEASWGRGVAVAANYAYVAAEAGLRVVDISDPAHPHEVGYWDNPGEARAWGGWDVAVVGHYAYVAGDPGLWVVDVSDPNRPDEVGYYNAPGDASGVAVADGCAYVADDSAGLLVVDVSDPTHPHEVGYYDYDETGPGDAYVRAMGVTVAPNYVYVAYGEGGLRVVDISDPVHPHEVGYCDMGYRPGNVAVVGDYAYVAEIFRGLQVVDVSDAANPREVGYYDTPGQAWDVAVADNHAYVAAGEEGLRVVDVSDPTHPHEVGYYDTPWGTWDVAVVGQYAYVEDWLGGLLILRYTGAVKEGVPPTEPTPPEEEPTQQLQVISTSVLQLPFPHPSESYISRLSPDGKKIAIAGDHEIAILDIDEGRKQIYWDWKVLLEEFGLSSIDPGSIQWSPDSRRIVLTEDLLYRFRESDVWVIDIEDETLLNLTDDGKIGVSLEELTEIDTVDWRPVWLDSENIAFLSGRHCEGNGVFQIRATGGSPTLLFDIICQRVTGAAHLFAWSPLTKQFIYNLFTGSFEEHTLWIADRAGQNREVILKGKVLGDPIEVSALGDKLLARMRDLPGEAEEQIVVVDLDTGEMSTLASRPSSDRIDRWATWSSDGTKIAYLSRENGLWVTNSNGANQRKIYDENFEQISGWSHDVIAALRSNKQEVLVMRIKMAEPIVEPTCTVRDLSTDKAQYYANEPITFRFTVQNQSASPITFRPVIKVVDANGLTTAFTGQKDYTLEAQQEMPIEHVQAPMAHPWTEGVTRWRVLLIGPPPHYEERYAETDLVGEFLVIPAATGDINAHIASLDVSPARVQIGDTLAIRFTLENTGERDWSFLVDGSIRGPGGYVDQLRQTISVPQGQVSPVSTFDWPVPADAPAGTYDVALQIYHEATVLDWWEAVASFMVDKEYSYVETREFMGPLGQRVAIHTHHAPGDVPGSLLLLDVLQKLNLLLSLYGAGSGGVLDTISAAIDIYGEMAPELLAETATDGSLDLLFLQLENAFNTGFLYNGVSFLDVGGKLIPPAAITAIPMKDIPPSGYWRLTAGTPVVGSSLEQMAQRYAPILYLHSDEVYAPDPVELMLDHASLREERAGMEPGPEILPRGAVTTRTFDTNNSPDYYLDLEPDLQSLQSRGEIRGCAGSPPYEDLYQRIYTQDDGVVYARAVQGPDWLVIQYWLFYFYNDWCNKHEGDWELVEVVFENVSSAEQVLATEIEPSFVAYSHHLGGERVPWSKAIWVQEGSAKRPLVFVARGSHANYPSPGWRFQLLGWDEAELGQRVDTKLLPIPQTEDGGLLPEGKWAKFIGRWGESGTGLSYAPRGLLAREDWKDPYEWAMKLPESDPTEDARALWAWLGSPVELHVYDAQGRHVGPNRAGGIDLEIPGAEYETDPETGHSLVKIPDFESRQGYRIVLEGTGAGMADLVVAVPDAEGRQQQVMEFTEVAVQPGLQAELEVTGELDSPLKLDADGDGVFEVRRKADETQKIALEVGTARVEGAGLWDRYSWLLVPLLLSGLAVVLILIAIRTSFGRKRAVQPSDVRCPKCGNLNRGDAKFCKYCGTELTSGR